MNNKLAYIFAIVVAAVAAVTAIAMPASAQRTRAAGPTCVENLGVPNPLGLPLCADLPPGPAPVPAPAPAPGGGRQEAPPAPAPAPGGNGGPVRAPAPRGEGGRPQPRSGNDRRVPRRTPAARVPAPGVEGKGGKRKPKRQPAASPELRKPDGTPTRSNPGFFESLPGPSQATGVPNFVIRKFRVPLFLLPIYQAAGIQYGVRWEILAAVNEIETDYGRNLNVSSAGAVGWMQFLPSTFKAYGVDGNKDGQKDPYNPVDAIFSAANYLNASGAEQDIRKAIFAYNHADWYVDSVLMRARLIAGVPEDVIGSLTGLTEGRFPVFARARYADDLAEADFRRKVRPGENAANVVEDDETRRGVRIFARRGAPVIAVNDGEIKKIGRSKELGRFVVLQDVYGNQYTYAGLDSVSQLYPAPDDEQGGANGNVASALPARAPKPTKPASAGRQVTRGKDRAPARRRGTDSATGGDSSGPKVVQKTRLFAHPERPGARRAGGEEQMMLSGKSDDGFTTFNRSSSKAFGQDTQGVRLRPLRVGSRVIGGTILGKLGKSDPAAAPHLYFEIRPAGRGAPLIDPKPILDGWKLLESTAIYRASGKNVLYGDDGFSVGQVLLLPKPLLQRRVLSDERIEIYDCGRRDIQTGQIDRRVLATLAYLSESGLRPTVTSLKCGHSTYTVSGNVSHHSSGNAVDIARVNGIPILGNQERGGVTEQTVRRLMRLQGTLAADQIISLLEIGGATIAMGDHADHIHVGFRPMFGSNDKLGQQAQAVLQPGQWSDLLSRLREIDNPTVPRNVSRFAIPAKRASDAHRGD